MSAIEGSIKVCGRIFSKDLLNQFNTSIEAKAQISKTAEARILCELTGWISPNGLPAVASARKAVLKLRQLGAVPEREDLSKLKAPKRPYRLRRSSHPLPALTKVPTRVERVRGLYLHRIETHKDELSRVWNDLIIDQHPCGSAPLAGPQIRYLVGSEHGWLGAIGFSSAAFVLGPRDQWIGWSTAARQENLKAVVGLSRFLIRQEVRCRNLASKLLSMALKAIQVDWLKQYGTEPLLVETFVDREKFTGHSLSASNWMRIGASSGRGRLGTKTPTKSLKDIWVFPVHNQARARLQTQEMPLAKPCSLLESLSQEGWELQELAGLQLGDKRLERRAANVLRARWQNPQRSFYGSFDSWTPAKGAYGFIEHKRAPISLQSLLEPHKHATISRMAAEKIVLLPQDTTTLNFNGLNQTSGLGPIGETGGAKGLLLHTLLAYRPDGVPLGILDAHCWARNPEDTSDKRGRNAKSIDEKESVRWLNAFQQCADAARRMPGSTLVNITDREGDLYELHDAVQQGPENLHVLVRSQHDRNLASHNKLWAFMEEQPAGLTLTIDIPRRRGQRAREAKLDVRWRQITIEAPKVGAKKGWKPLSLWAVLAKETNPPEGNEPIEWMLLTDLPITSPEEAWEKVIWYRCRWGIEEWHRVLKTGCKAEEREFKTAEHLQRVLAFDLIVAWRVLACIKLGRVLPQLPAEVLYTPEELLVLKLQFKKNSAPR